MSVWCGILPLATSTISKKFVVGRTYAVQRYVYVTKSKNLGDMGFAEMSSIWERYVYVITMVLSLLPSRASQYMS